MFSFLTGICHADSSSGNPYISIKLNTTWNVFCTSLQQFRNQISNITGIKNTLIVLTNADQESCSQLGRNQVTVFVNVMKDGGSVDLDQTLILKEKLERVLVIGSYKVN